MDNPTSGDEVVSPRWDESDTEVHVIDSLENGDFEMNDLQKEFDVFIAFIQSMGYDYLNREGKERFAQVAEALGEKEAYDEAVKIPAKFPMVGDPE